MEIDKEKPEKIIILEDVLKIKLCLNDKKNLSEIPNSFAVDDNNSVTHLNLSDNELKDIKCLKKFTDLEYLFLYNNELTSIDDLQEYLNLKELRLGKNKISNINALEKLENITSLYIPGNEIKDIGVLKNLTFLSKLVLSSNQIKNIDSLKNLKYLKELSLGGNALTDITALEDLVSLEILYLGSNKIQNINPLKNLNNLQTLSLSYNQITENIETIKNIIPIASLRSLHINNNPFVLNEGLSLVTGENHLNNIFKKNKIFISYSRKDIDFKNELKKHLNILSQFDITDNWSCEDIKIGNWNEQIQKELEESNLIIYMLSANFFSSSYILEKEVENIMNEKRNNKAILCVIVSDFIDLDKIENYLRNWHISDKQKAILMLKNFQYLPYEVEYNRITGQNEEKLTSLKKYSIKNDIETALKQISEKVLNIL